MNLFRYLIFVLIGFTTCNAMQEIALTKPLRDDSLFAIMDFNQTQFQAVNDPYKKQQIDEQKAKIESVYFDSQLNQAQKAEMVRDLIAGIIQLLCSGNDDVFINHLKEIPELDAQYQQALKESLLKKMGVTLSRLSSKPILRTRYTWRLPIPYEHPVIQDCLRQAEQGNLLYVCQVTGECCRILKHPDKQNIKPTSIAFQLQDESLEVQQQVVVVLQTILRDRFYLDMQNIVKCELATAERIFGEYRNRSPILEVTPTGVTLNPDLIGNQTDATQPGSPNFAMSNSDIQKYFIAKSAIERRNDYQQKRKVK